MGDSLWLLGAGLGVWGLAYYPIIAMLTIITTIIIRVIFMGTIQVGAITILSILETRKLSIEKWVAGPGSPGSVFEFGGLAPNPPLLDFTMNCS